jgi:hypothetical protein
MLRVCHDHSHIIQSLFDTASKAVSGAASQLELPNDKLAR